MMFSMHDTGASVLLGVATLFLFLGYFAHDFVTEAVLHSVYKRDSNVIDKYAGYYGQAVQLGVFSVSCILSPSLVRWLTSKGSLCICAGIFSLFFLGYMYINKYYFYCSQGLMGFGYALFNNAEGAYLAEHSTLATLENNMALETGIGHGGMFFSGGILYLVSLFNNRDSRDEIDYSNEHIRILYLSFLITAVLSLGMYLILPNERPKDSLACSDLMGKISLSEQTRSTLGVLVNSRMLIFLPASLYQGAFSAFTLSVYPASFSFDLNLRKDVFLVAFYCGFIGIGEVLGSVVISYFSRRIRNFGIIYSMWLHFLLMVLLLISILLSTSEQAFIMETSAPAHIIQPNRWTVCLIALLVGFCDCGITTARGIMCQRILPGKRMEAFSITKFVHAFSGCAVLIVSPYLSVTTWVIIFSSMLIMGGYSYLFVAYKVQRDEQKKTQISTEPSVATIAEHSL